MDYSDVTASFDDPQPSPPPVPTPIIDASPARRLRDAIEPIAMHSVWSQHTNEQLAALGLNFLTAYVWGRAAALGEPEPGTVVSSFAVFEPTLVASAYDAGRATVNREQLLEVRTTSTISSLTDALDRDEPAASTPGGADLVEVAQTLRAAVGTLDGMGRPLFSGLRSQPWPTEPVGVLWRACELAREHRGDGHIAVCLSEGLDPIKMNILTELFVGFPLGTYSASRGWSPDQLADAATDLRDTGLVDGDDLSESGLEYRREIERRTDDLDQPIVDAIGDIEAVLTSLTHWSAQCIGARSFPPDPLKRAAG